MEQIAARFSQFGDLPSGVNPAGVVRTAYRRPRATSTLTTTKSRPAARPVEEAS
jgi:hypothetical protein